MSATDYIRELEDTVIASDPFQIMPLTRRILAERPDDLEAVGIVGCYCEPRTMKRHQGPGEPPPPPPDIGPCMEGTG